MPPPKPLYRGQGNEPYKTADARTGAQRGQTVPYDINGAPTGASGAAADISFSPAGSVSATDVQAAIVELDTEKLAASSYTAADVLAKLLTVDGTGSLLDADLLDGQHGTFYLARANHTGTQLAATISDFSTAVGLLNALTATTLQTSRNFSISGGGITAAAVGFNGSASVTLSASVDAGHITLARMADVATSTVFYRKTAGTGAPEVQTLATLKTDLGLTGTNSGDQTITLTGDVTGSGTGSFAATIANDAVTYAKMQNVSATSRIMGRITAAAGDMEELTAANVKTILALAQADISGLTTADSPQFTAVNIGHASDTTVTRVSAGVLAIEGANIIVSGGPLGTPSSGTLTNCTGLPVAGITASTSTALGVGSIELGHASDTTIARVGAGQISVEGVNVVTISSTDTLTNKTLTTPVINGLPTGTGVAAAATASTLMSRDSNGNTAANNVVQAFTTTATAAGTTTMTIASTATQVFTGTSTQTVKLPTTSVLQGQQYLVINQSTGNVTVQSSGANTITVLGPGTWGLFTAVIATPTTAANWASQVSDTGTAWTSYTPTVAAGSGAFTSVAAVGAYKQIGKTVFVRIKVTITTNGTAALYFTVTAPTTSVNAGSGWSQIFPVKRTDANGTGGTGQLDNNSNLIYVVDYSGAYLGGSGYVLNITGSYETA